MATPTSIELATELADLTVEVPADTEVVSRSDAAYYRIRDLVVTLELAPGAPIHEPELMARLGLGRTPVREALHRLAREGLVTIWPRRGMVVAGVDVRDLTAITQVRLQLEPLAARLAAQRLGGQASPRAGGAGADDEAAVAGLFTDLEGVPDAPRALIRVDQRVHRFVHRAAANPYLAGTLEEYLILSLRLWFLGLERVGHLAGAVREHRDLLAAVRAGDGDRAAAISADHVQGFQQAIGRVIAGG